MNTFRRRAPALDVTASLIGGLLFCATLIAVDEKPAASPRPPFRLREVPPAPPHDAAPERLAAPPQVEAPLSEEVTARLLSSLGVDDRISPRDPTATAPLPAAGGRPPPRDAALAPPLRPPARGASASTAQALDVLRRSPEGEVDAALQLSITFSEPMVAIGAHRELAAGEVSVRIAPEVAGRWRWVGTRTLLFEAAGGAWGEGFPPATEFRVEVPAGTASVLGHALKDAAAWNFSTPPPRLLHFHSEEGPQRRTPLLLAVFDQRIELSGALQTVRVRTTSTEHAVRLVSREEVEADESVRDPYYWAHRKSRLEREAVRRGELDGMRDPRRMLEPGGSLLDVLRDGYWIAFRPVAPLPLASRVQVFIGSGVPSAHGVRRSAQAQAFEVETHGALSVKRVDPGPPLTIYFSNPLDVDVFTPSQVRIEPAIERAEVRMEPWGCIAIEGAPRAGETYRVSLAPTLRDRFGQSLGQVEPVTIEMPPPKPELWILGEGMGVLPPGETSIPVYTARVPALRVRAYRVGPEHWQPFHLYVQQASGNDGEDDAGPLAPPGALVFERRIEVRDEGGELTLTRIDLRPTLTGGCGQLVVAIEAAERLKGEWMPSRAVWLQATGIHLEAYADRGEVIAWASSLASGKSLADVEVRLSPSGGAGRTGPDGLVRIPLAPGLKSPLLVAQQGEDVTLLPASGYWNDEYNWEGEASAKRLRCFAFSDRPLYRPGESVCVKGWLRRIDDGKGGDVELPGDEPRRLAYRLIDQWDHETLLEGEVEVGRLGGFDVAVSLPQKRRLVDAELVFRDPRAARADDAVVCRVALRVESFRRPDFEVDVSLPPGPVVAGETAALEVLARYLDGGVLPGAKVTWEVKSVPLALYLPDWERFTFGTWTPSWIEDDEEFHRRWSVHHERFTGVTDRAGRHRLGIEVERFAVSRPLRLHATASVQDLDRQEWSAYGSAIVLPAALHVGLRADRPFARAGDPWRVEVVATDLDGGLLVGRTVRFELLRLEWQGRGRERVRRESLVEVAELKSASVVIGESFTFAAHGVYRVRASASDDAGRRTESEVTVWVSGADGEAAATGATAAGDHPKVVLVSDRASYRSGDVAEVELEAPFYPAEGLVLLLRSGIIYTERFRLEGPLHRFRFPIGEEHVPHLYVHVSLIGPARRAAAGTEDGRPAVPQRAFGSVTLSVPPVTRRLAVEAAPRRRDLAPGDGTVIDVSVVDFQGQPVVSAEVAVVVVDDAVYALGWKEAGDPIENFYIDRPSDTTGRWVHSHLLRLDPESATSKLRALRAPRVPSLALGSSDSDKPEPVHSETLTLAAPGRDPAGETPEPRLRADFNPLALFAPSVWTDEHGRAEAAVTLPGNLTRYRVLVFAAAGAGRFGSARSSITATLPLQVRLAPPRFLSLGDRFELPVLLQNRRVEPIEVDLAVRAKHFEWLGPTGRRVTVPAGDRVEVRFPARVPRVGTVTVEAAVASGELADAVRVDVPVRAPLTAETFATHGEITAERGAVAYPLAVPAGITDGFGGLEVTAASTALLGLADAAYYLAQYPFGCAEQAASSLLAAAALKPLGAAGSGGPAVPGAAELVVKASGDIQRLEALRHRDGGFGLWPRSPSDPFVSVHAAHALARAHEAGFEVPAELLEHAARYLEDVSGRLAPEVASDERRAIEAYALRVRALLDLEGEQRNETFAGARALAREDVPLEAAAWLLQAIGRDPGSRAEAEVLRRQLVRQVVETAGKAEVAAAVRSEGRAILPAPQRAQALVLEALLECNHEDDLTSKLARGLVARQVRGRWSNTQDNAFALMALARFLALRESEEPAFTARAWLAERFLGEHEIHGHSFDRVRFEAPMRAVHEAGSKAALTIAKDGPGRLYYRVALSYVPSGDLEPAEHGFAVERRYEAVDEPGDVRVDAGGVWRVRSGARVRARLLVASTATRHHVAVVDPLPAGFEVEDPGLRPARPAPRARQIGDDALHERLLGIRIQHTWFGHRELRDDRVELFADVLEPGGYKFEYTVRARTPGSFTAPPPRAEEMYDPETFGRGRAERVVVE